MMWWSPSAPRVQSARAEASSYGQAVTGPRGKWSVLGGEAGDGGLCVDVHGVRLDQRDPECQLYTEDGEGASQARSAVAAPVASAPISAPVVAQNLELRTQEVSHP